MCESARPYGASCTFSPCGGRKRADRRAGPAELHGLALCGAGSWAMWRTAAEAGRVRMSTASPGSSPGTQNPVRAALFHRAEGIRIWVSGHGPRHRRAGGLPAPLRVRDARCTLPPRRGQDRATRPRSRTRFARCRPVVGDSVPAERAATPSGAVAAGPEPGWGPRAGRGGTARVRSPPAARVGGGSRRAGPTAPEPAGVASGEGSGKAGDTVASADVPSVADRVRGVPDRRAPGAPGRQLGACGGVPAPPSGPGVAPTRRRAEPDGTARSITERADDHLPNPETGGGTPIDAVVEALGTFDRGSGDVPRTGRCDPPTRSLP